jgi:hypothetical protein
MESKAFYDKAMNTPDIEHFKRSIATYFGEEIASGRYYFREQFITGKQKYTNVDDDDPSINFWMFEKEYGNAIEISYDSLSDTPFNVEIEADGAEPFYGKGKSLIDAMRFAVGELALREYGIPYEPLFILT